MNNALTIKESRILKHPDIMWTIIKNTPTLDPLIIPMNAPLYILYKDDVVVGFVSIKKWGDTIELGTLYVYPSHRGRKYAQYLCFEVMKKYEKVYLLCKPEMVPIYSQHGFVVDPIQQAS